MKTWYAFAILLGAPFLSISKDRIEHASMLIPPIANFESPYTNICSYTCINFNDLSLNNPTSWHWSFPGASPATSNAHNPSSICYFGPGSYDVQLIVSNAAGSDTLFLPGYITVNPIPPAPVITVSGNILTSSAAPSYQWYLTGSAIPGATNQQLVISQSGFYQVVIEDAAGCQSGDTVTVALMFPESGFNSNMVSGCPGTCFDFTNASLNAATYHWSFPGANTVSSTLQNPSNICYAGPGVYDVTLIASSSFASDTLTLSGYITIFNPVAVAISQSGNILTCNPAAGSYQWSLNGSQIPGATSQSLTINQPGNYTVDVIDSNGCSASNIINVTLAPVPGFIAIDSSVCKKFCTGFVDQSTNNPTAWHWIFQGASPATSTQQNPTNICYNNAGVYDVTLITTNASGNDTLTLPAYIKVYTAPNIPSITQSGYTLTSTAASGYQWQLNTLDIPGATNQSYDVTQSGYYTVFIFDQHGCTSSATKYVLITALDEVVKSSDLLIFPNPSDGNFTIESHHFTTQNEIQLEVRNTLGQLIYYSSEPGTAGITGDFKKEISLKNGTSGIYFLEIKSGEELINIKLMIKE